MKLSSITFLLLLLTQVTFSQQDSIPESNSLENQFDKIYRTSTTYQTYKVIGRDRFLELKKNVLDSLQKATSEISEKQQLLIAERNNVKELNAELDRTREELAKTQEKENSISLFGAQLNKTTYNLILWLIIISLALALAFFVFKFSRSNVLTKKAQDDLVDVEQEFEMHRKKSLEREQKLRRQLQDEINKQRNS